MNLEKYVEDNLLSKKDYELICKLLKENKNIVVGGLTNIGKTTLINALMDKMMEYYPEDIYYIQDLYDGCEGLKCKANSRTEFNLKGRNEENVKKAFKLLRLSYPKHIITETMYTPVIANETMQLLYDAKDMGWNVISSIHANSIEDISNKIKLLNKNFDNVCLFSEKIEPFIDLFIYIDKHTRKITVQEAFYEYN